MGSVLFMLLFSPVGALGEALVFYLTGGHKVLLASMVVRPFFKDGFREGEALGVTPLAFGDGLVVSEDSPQEEGQSLQKLLTYLLPDMPVSNKRYLLTVSEYKTLDRMLVPVAEVLEMLREKADGRFEIEEIHRLHGLAVKAAIPVAEFLLRMDRMDPRRVVKL